MQSTTANAFAADLILPADVSHVAMDGDALVVRPNGNEETQNGNYAIADCPMQTTQQSTPPNKTSISAGFDGRLGVITLLC